MDQNPFQSAIEAHISRVEALYARMAEMEQKAIEQSKTAIDESARLSRETLAYGTSLAAEWRKASLEATRNAFKMWSFPFAS